jgi:histidyl-tRNA synthetase
LLQAVFESLGLNPGQIGTAFNLVDKLEKLELADFRRSLVESLGLADPEIDRVLAFTSARSIQDLEAISIPNSELWQASLNNLYSIWALAEAQGIGAWLKVNTSVVRGLAYYDGMTFECNYNGGVGRQRALCGGGRYDHLMSDYDPSFKLPCVGFAVGDIVVTELLIELGRLPDLKRHVTYCLGAVSDDLYRELVAYAKRGRDKGLQIDICGKSKFKQILAYADKIGAEEAVIFAPTEWADGRKVILKELRKGGGQSLVPVEELF